MFTLPTEPQKTLKIFVTSFDFWKSHYKQLLLTVLATIALGSVPTVMFQDPLATYHLASKNLEVFVPSVIIYMLIMYVLFAFVLHRVYCIMYNKTFSIGYSFLLALKKLPYLVITMLLYEVFTFLGFILLIAPGVAILFLLAMSFPLVVVDDENPISAIKKSWQLTSPNWWHTFSVLFILTAGIVLIVLCVDEIAVRIYMLVHPAGWGILPIGRALLKMGADMVFFPFYVTTIMMLLHDLKLRQKTISTEAVHASA